MNETRIITNNHPRELYYLFQLDEKTQEYIRHEFDWIESSEIESWDESLFFKFKDSWYCLSEFMNLNNTVYYPNKPECFKDWDGYKSDSFFSGILIRFPTDYDYESVIVGWYCS